MQDTKILVKFLRERRGNLSELARRAGVSRGTIYSILRDGHYISRDLHRKVRGAAIEMINELSGEK